MKCYKCDGKIALVKYNYKFENGLMSVSNRMVCLPCIYQGNVDWTPIPINYIKWGKSIMPFTKLELEKIRNGEKWTSLRSLKYDKYPFEKEAVFIFENGHHLPLSPDGYVSSDHKLFKNDKDLVIAEGFKNFYELITGLEKKGFKLPQEFLLYDLRKPI